MQVLAYDHCSINHDPSAAGFALLSLTRFTTAILFFSYEEDLKTIAGCNVSSEKRLP
jgi:hypothetical protein